MDVVLKKISRQSLLEKNFDLSETEVRERFTGDELDVQLKLIPTPDEAEWMKIFTHNAPELARVQRRMLVCFEFEVEEIRDDYLSGTYCAQKLEFFAPKNSFKISRALENSKHDAFAELCAQNCVKIDGLILTPQKTNAGVDTLSLSVKIADRFFFQSYAG